MIVLAMKLAFTALGIVPLAYVVYREWRFSIHVDAAFYWLGLAFGVSFLADVTGFLFGQPSIAWQYTYVIGQSVLVAACFLSREQAKAFLVALCLVGLVSPFVRLGNGRDLLLHTFAWAGVAAVVVPEARGRLRLAILTYFGGGMAAHAVLALSPTLAALLLYQLTRVVGIGLFCFAVADPKPVKLTLHRARTA